MELLHSGLCLPRCPQKSESFLGNTTDDNINVHSILSSRFLKILDNKESFKVNLQVYLDGHRLSTKPLYYLSLKGRVLVINPF